MQKRIHDLKIGDMVTEHGGTFEIVAAARYSIGHGPRIGIRPIDGPSDCAVAIGVCVSGSIPGYFAPGTEWTFQGNFRAPMVTLA